MKRTLRALAAFAVTLSLSACFEMKSVVTVSKDGSATLEETALVGAQLKAMLGSLGAQPGTEGQPNPAAGLKDILPDKAKAEARAKELGEGVTVKLHEEITSPDGRSGVRVTYAVADIRKLKYVPFDAKEQGGTSPSAMTFSLAGDTLTLVNPIEDKAGEEIPKVEPPKMPKEQMEAQMAMMKPMFAGMRMSMVVKSASGISSSNATHLEGDTVTLMDMQFDKLLDKPELFTKFMDAADKKPNQAEMAEMFKGVDGIKVESKDTITIKLQ
ncbi:MAG: hypothetical protein ACOYMN_21545 [Roseimicrobium sp.]